MTIWKRGLVLVFNLLLFALAWALNNPHQNRWHDAATWGSAAPEVRAAVLSRLRAFQDGYTRRNTAEVDAFMARLFSRDHPVVLGTMPGEIRAGYDAARELVRSDWESWGDCRFRLDQTQVSAAGDVAWFATPGSVKFDLSRFLVLPLRLSGVMVKEDAQWKLRQVQYQFDLDLSTLLLIDVVLLIWLAINAALLLVAAARRLTRSEKAVRT